jgi:hypothetical protein
MMKLLAFSIPLVAALALYAGCDDETSTGPTGATCEPTDPACPAVAVNSDCLALVDNSGKDVFVQRLSQLSITAPEALKTELVYGVISQAVYLNLPVQCNIKGDGTFSLVTEFDIPNGRLRVGGAYPEVDPLNGY